MAFTKDDNLNAADLLEIQAVSLIAGLRGGHYTSRQKKHLDRIQRRADRREDKQRDKH